MERSISIVKSNDETSLAREDHNDFRCFGCNESFHRPILATDSSRGSVRTYYACPRCLSQVNITKTRKREEDEMSSVSLEQVKKAVLAKDEDRVECKHFLGYLKKRAKDAPIPDECLTCDKMIACVSY